MDDFQLRIVRAAERLAGGSGGPDIGDRLDELRLAIEASGVRLDMLNARLLALVAVQEAILDKMPGRP
jgi:hypothetical protein